MLFVEKKKNIILNTIIFALLFINFNVYCKNKTNKQIKNSIASVILKNTKLKNPSPKNSAKTTEIKNKTENEPQSTTIDVYKKGVKYSFVPFNGSTDHFAKQIFPTWEPETFEVFDKVKDPKGIAIDLGAWIGTTAIWCCKNFNHVIAIDADKSSLECLQNNLKASDCSNITICNRPVAKTGKQFIFGPRGRDLNESISYIKEQSDNVNDYAIQGITFKQLIHDFVYKNDTLKNQKISFIKCDIEGGEEDILEDILHFAYHNEVKAYISFHISWWKDKNIKKFEYLFNFFKNNCPNKNVIEYLQKNPFGSVLFEPKKTTEALIKQNIPAVIIGYNQITYIKNMVAQLEKYTSDIIVIDNNSTYPPLLDYYNNEFKYTLLKQTKNYGHHVFNKDFVQNLVGNLYILTDPDLQFNEKLPINFIDKLIEISQNFKAYKVGFALSIDPELIRSDIKWNNHTIYDWEKHFWTTPLIYTIDPSLVLYSAPIDTTFCLINKQFTNGCEIRVAGNYTCLHIPWLKTFKDYLAPEEIEHYLKNNTSTSWFKS